MEKYTEDFFHIWTLLINYNFLAYDILAAYAYVSYDVWAEGS